MTDSKLRELERRWQETGSIEDEAAYLRERMRVGDLTRDQIALAAHCGHEAARLAAEPAVGVLQRMLEAAGRVIQGGRVPSLKKWGPEAQARAALVIARRALEDHRTREVESPQTWSQSRAVVDALEAWARCPCKRHEHEAMQAGKTLCKTVDDEIGLHGRERTDALQWAVAVSFAGLAPTEPGQAASAEQAAIAARMLLTNRPRQACADEIWAEVSESLIAWTLGRDRHAAP